MRISDWSSDLGSSDLPDGEVLKPETNDFANLLLRFVSGMTMQLQVSWNATLTPGWTLEAFGSKGRFVARAPTFPTSRDPTLHAGADRKSVVTGTSVSARYEHGGRRLIKKKTQH